MRWLVAVWLCAACCGAGALRAQSFEIQQLVLDIEKLTQLKDILKDLKEGYQVLDKGYSAIRDISQGNFNLHKAYLDGLLAVSPAVKNYARVAEIINLQLSMVSKYQAAWGQFQKDQHFRPDELGLMAVFFGNLLDESAKALDDLATILTDGTIRASDAERLKQIDAIDEGMVRRDRELEAFDRSTVALSLGRASDEADYEAIKKLYGTIP